MTTLLDWKTTKKYLVLTSCLVVQVFMTFPAIALKISLGVVKSRENSGQWEQITNRLKATGIDYCRLDADDWQDVSDLRDIRVLMLPNVSNLNGAQVQTLDTWTKAGGKLIVTGPTGILSPSEVRSQLQEVIGAYWGFSNNTVSTLQLQESQKAVWGRGLSTYTNIVGGTLIPTEKEETETVAIWINEGKLPGVVSTPQAVYLGWRWGEDKVSSLDLDTTWLEAALNHYGISGPNSLLRESDSRVCTQKRPKVNENRPILPDVN